MQRVEARQSDVTDANQRAQVRETIGRRKLEDEYNRFLQEMRGEAYVNIRTGAQAQTDGTPANAPAAAPAETPAPAPGG